MASYSEFYKKKNKELFGNRKKESKENNLENINFYERKKEQIASTIRQEKTTFIEDKKKNYSQKKRIDFNFVLLLFMAILIIGLFFILRRAIVENIVIASFIIVIILVVFFFLLSNLFNIYQNKLQKINPVYVLFFAYGLLIFNIFFGSNYYSIEWQFLGFVVAAVLIYDSKIDSRFLIFPAILILAYIPFLLIGKQTSVAEKAAIYVYYFLVIGVFLQLFESYNEKENSLDFIDYFKNLLKNINWNNFLIFFGILTIGIIILNRFYNVEIFKWSAVYLFFVTLVLQIINYIIKD